MNNSYLSKIVDYNYLVEPWKEGDRLISKIYRKKDLKINENIPLGLYIGKNSRLIYKMHYLSVIISKYIYYIKKHVKIYKYMMFNIKKLLVNNFYKKYKKLIKKKSIFLKNNKNNKYNKSDKYSKFKTKFNNRVIIIFKYNLFIYYKKWFRKKFKIERKKLWNTFYKTSVNFWGNKYKKIIKRFLFNLLDKKYNLSNYYLLNYEQIINNVFSILNKKKSFEYNNKKKKNILNISDNTMVRNTMLFDIKNNTNNLFFANFNKFSLLLNNINNTDEIISLYKQFHLFIVNLNYYIYLLNIKNNNIFNKNIFSCKKTICNFYENLYYIYKNDKYVNGNYVIRTGIIHKKNLLLSLHLGSYFNIYISWLNIFNFKYFDKSIYVVNKLTNKMYNSLTFLKNNSCRLFYDNNIHFNFFNYIKKIKKTNKILFFLRFVKKNNIFINNKSKNAKNFFYKKNFLGRNLKRHLYNRIIYYSYPYQIKKINKYNKNKNNYFKKKVTSIYNNIEINNNIFKRMLVSFEKGTNVILKKNFKFSRKFKTKENGLLNFEKLHFLKKYKKIFRKRIYYKIYIFKKKKMYNNYRKFIKKNNVTSTVNKYRKKYYKNNNIKFNNKKLNKKFKFFDFFKKNTIKSKYKFNLKLKSLYYRNNKFFNFRNKNNLLIYIKKKLDRKLKTNLSVFNKISYFLSKYSKAININFYNVNNTILCAERKNFKLVNTIKKQLNSKIRLYGGTKNNIQYNKKIKKKKVYLFKRNKYLKKYYWFIYRMSYVYKELLLLYIFKLKTLLVSRDRYFLSKKHNNNHFFSLPDRNKILTNILFLSSNDHNNFIFNNYNRWISVELSKYFFLNKINLLNNISGYYYKNIYFKK